MRRYDSVIIINGDIYDKITHYKSFLEKTEFNTLCENTVFVKGNPADDLASAGLNNARKFIYVYGLLDVESYKEAYERIEILREANPNSGYYMLFCHERGKIYNSPLPVQGVVRNTYSIGIVEDEDSIDAKGNVFDENYNNDTDEIYSDDKRALKLLSFVLAMQKKIREGSDVTFSFYYIAASLKMNYRNIYYSVLHTLSEYACRKVKKRAGIANRIREIERLKKKKPKLCKGNFPEEGSDEGQDLGAFNSYDDMEKLRRDMEFIYEKKLEVINGSVTGKISVARKALAVADRNSTVECGNIEETVVKDNDCGVNRYMLICDENEKKIPEPSILLKRAGRGSMFDIYRLRSLLPLAREFNSQLQYNPGKVILFSLGAVLLFALSVCSVYAFRYFKHGLNGVNASDIFLAAGVPAGIMLLSGVAGLVTHLVFKYQQKNIFRSVYDMLCQFLDSAKELCAEVGEYINNYLTVYYNHHVKYTKISSMEEEIAYLENEIKRIENDVIPLNRVAENICRMAHEKYDQPFDSSESVSVSEATERIVKMVLESPETECKGVCMSSELSLPWIIEAECVPGNVCGGGV